MNYLLFWQSRWWHVNVLRHKTHYVDLSWLNIDNEPIFSNEECSCGDWWYV